MQVQRQQENINSIAHSPYYGCTVRVLSKANVSYEGVLDGISTNKDRIFLKDVRVNGNINGFLSRGNSFDHVDKSNASDALNAVMLDHLTNDMRIYEAVCLNVRDIQELRLIQMPSTIHETKAKLRAIDPCLLDIRLSPGNDLNSTSNGPTGGHRQHAPIARHTRVESYGSTGGSALLSSSSNESSSSFGHPGNGTLADESNDESIDEQIDKFTRLTTQSSSTTHSNPTPATTLLAKKVLSKKIERRADPATTPTPSTNTTNGIRHFFSENRETTYATTRTNNNGFPTNTKKSPMIDHRRRSSPIRVTITSKLNPDAAPFFAPSKQQRPAPAPPNTSFTFYERRRFRPNLQPVPSPDRSHSVSYGIPISHNTMHQHQQQLQQQQHHHHHQQQQQQQQQNHQQTHHYHQRFVPPRQMAIKKNYASSTPPRTQVRSNQSTSSLAPQRIYSSSTSLTDKRLYYQQTHTQKRLSYDQLPGFPQQISPSPAQEGSTPPLRERFSVPVNGHQRQSSTHLRSTVSVPYQHSSSFERNQLQVPTPFGEPIGSRRGQRTVSGTSSGSSLSVDIGPHSITQMDSTLSALTGADGQYDFEKANEEFRRYLELEELVTRQAPSNGPSESHPDDNQEQQQQKQQQSLQQRNSYKKEVSFFDSISCSATTGTAVGYTEMDETEKNRETFGDDALLMLPDLNDEEWQF